ncbi:hypothetical protein GT030_07970 [Streptomyces sp. SID1328]|uniref:discoidin domain-containing protein n=1 Tax=Streptomyces sp. SID1328 TaxID=2690250 RepID=UPI001369EF87|nr:discoidin domain-containing protein [Streptomyces sp. SID1328]MYV38808.1 hypothetical protein [Streptomyces sp. SID1328]
MGTVTQTTAAAPGTDADFGSQLQYSLTTVPDPLTVSPPGTVETRDLIIVGSRIAPTAIETNEISVYVPTGTEAWQLAPDLTGLQTSITLTGWTATIAPGNERILFKPDTGHATLTPEQGFTLQLNKLRVNHEVGTAPIRIELKWREPNTGTWKTDTQILAVGKFPAGFYLRNLKPHSAYIENGDTVTLTWERSEDATYHLLYENVEIDVTNYSTFPVHDIRRNTMFYLRGRIQAGTGTVERTINTYVTVNRPDLDIRNLTVHGDLVMPRVRQTASTEYDLIDGHTPDLMLDGNLDTYFLLSGTVPPPKWTIIDLGVEQDVEEVDIYFGTPEGEHLPPGTVNLGYSLTGNGFYPILPSFNNVGTELHYRGSLRARYLNVSFSGSHTVAIRSFEVRPQPDALKITHTSAVLNVPLTTNAGTTADTDTADDAPHT